VERRNITAKNATVQGTIQQHVQQQLKPKVKQVQQQQNKKKQHKQGKYSCRRNRMKLQKNMVELINS